MRPTRLKVQLPSSTGNRSATNAVAARPFEAVLIEVDVSVVALDVGVGARARGKRGLAGTHAGRARGRFAGRGLAPGAAPFRCWRHDGTEAGAARLGGVHRVVAARCCGGGRCTGQAPAARPAEAIRRRRAGDSRSAQWASSSPASVRVCGSGCMKGSVAASCGQASTLGHPHPQRPISRGITSCRCARCR